MISVPEAGIRFQAVGIDEASRECGGELVRTSARAYERRPGQQPGLARWRTKGLPSAFTSIHIRRAEARRSDLREIADRPTGASADTGLRRVGDVKLARWRLTCDRGLTQPLELQAFLESRC